MTREKIRIALAGNPNSGKTTLFNALTGAHHKVGNYPGVTVEKKEGSRIRGSREYHFVDLPGIYSLTAYSIDEVVARDFLLDEKPDLIVDVLDSTNLERHLYLCLQFQELGIPVIGALNMTDEAEAKGIQVDSVSLSGILGIPMVKTVGPRGAGVDELLDKVDEVLSSLQHQDRSIRYGDEIEGRLQHLQALIGEDETFSSQFPSRWLALKLLEKDINAYERLKAHRNAEAIAAEARTSINWLEKHYGKDNEIVISEQRYGYIRGAVRECIKIVKKSDFSVTEMIDKVIMHPLLSLPIFVLVLWGMFQLTFTLGEYPMAWLEGFFTWLSGTLNGIMGESGFKSLLIDGVIAGVGGVLSFVPLIIILFFLLSILEDIGYMSRAAFATDKFLHTFGLHGQSIFPMMLGFGCSVPAIMAARTLKSRRDRILTILVIPFISCGAKLPVYVLLAAAFFPNNPALMVMAIYGIGVVLSLVAAFVLNKTILRGDPTPFVMELPPYRSPTLRGILWHVWDKTWQYVKKAGTVILAASILIWAITSFPGYTLPEDQRENLRQTYMAENPNSTPEEVSEYIDIQESELRLANSFAGRLGRLIEPLFKPLGFDWKIGVAMLTGFAAKEVIVSTLGILYGVGHGESEESESLRAALQQDPAWNPLVAFVLMLFVLVIPPCFAAQATMRAELGWSWWAFSVLSLLVFGWLLGFAIYQIGLLVGALA
ncbi:ferrous iron transport protein B [Gracilinema caldarium]|uniref:ferrous iron transport protein B n=1 Tax=Gracilinema caldarium TaxID=215591 RepID=UPI0026E9A8DD|nr:ferrous iron transport protein B [Gracilinema caldarium]